MDFFDGHNYRVNKILLLAIGQWPYQSSRTSHTIVIIIVTIVCTQIFTKLCGMFVYIHDMDIVIECLVPLMVDVSGMTKIMNSVLCVNEIRALLDRIKNDFYSLRNSNDIMMLEKYADSGKKSSTIYICVIYMLTVAFLLMPLQPLILQVTNVTRPMLHRVEYYVDMDKYYFPILIHGYFTALICVTSIVATDAIFVIFMQHACGLFIITGSRIEQAVQKVYETEDANPPITKDTAYRNMIQCVHDHRTAIRFANLIEIVYSKHFLFHAGLNMIAMSVTGVGTTIETLDVDYEDIESLNNLDVTNTMQCVKHAKNCALQNVFKIYNWWSQRQKELYQI
ncbi:hypothetical protein ALC62_10874 [Cyphomyrmex costatus]|uniref:Odorant receptor n=1 Tax=Cyphomyrmex costatus TaxID=456900 RepID=A0A151IDC3_9HYME|nr:hypothetical protein ALC62_10874 [Cyphomyrmex costatus]